MKTGQDIVFSWVPLGKIWHDCKPMLAIVHPSFRDCCSVGELLLELPEHLGACQTIPFDVLCWPGDEAVIFPVATHLSGERSKRRPSGFSRTNQRSAGAFRMKDQAGQVFVEKFGVQFGLKNAAQADAKRCAVGRVFDGFLDVQRDRHHHLIGRHLCVQ